MKTKLTHSVCALLIAFMMGVLPVYAQFTVSPTTITTTGIAGSTASGTQSISVNWTFTGSSVGTAPTATYTVNGVSSSAVTCVKTGTGQTRTYTCPVANINLSWSAICGGANGTYSASANTTHPSPIPVGGPTTITASCTVPLPINKTDATAMVQGKDVNLSWKVTSSTDIERYEIQKWLKDDFQTIATIQDAAIFSTTLNNLPAGKHTFRIVSLGKDGSKSMSPAMDVMVELPGNFELTNAYPNPFNPMTKFSLTVGQTQNVQVEVFNTMGQKVATLFEGQVVANEVNMMTFDAGNLPSGIYVYRVIGSSFVASKQVILMK